MPFLYSLPLSPPVSVLSTLTKALELGSVMLIALPILLSSSNTTEEKQTNKQTKCSRICQQKPYLNSLPYTIASLYINLAIGFGLDLSENIDTPMSQPC